MTAVAAPFAASSDGSATEVFRSFEEAVDGSLGDAVFFSPQAPVNGLRLAYSVPGRGALRLELPPGTDAPEWLAGAAEQLVGLLSLRPGWTRGGREIAEGTARKAMQILFELMPFATHPPEWSPLPDGGIQLEWYGREVEIDLEMSAAGEATFYSEDTVRGEVHEGSLPADAQELREDLARA